MPRERTELDTPRLTLLAYTPEQLLALIEQPERFEETFAFTPADGLRGFYVSGDVSPQWLEALRAAVGQGPNPGVTVFSSSRRRAARSSAGRDSKARPMAQGWWRSPMASCRLSRGGENIPRARAAPF